ncbi:MAG: diacylglycerol kinase family lipid kinase [Hyphomicrobiales bacterium]|nr:diacylglycerol kinase family lipid kinase [Hyphomicrobiales bacterium]MDE2116047.1 diacylglycerol kinase family lipid kinase [Hyphomicrobiales bacterium]
MEGRKRQVLTCILNDRAGSNSAAQARELVDKVAVEHGWQARVLVFSGGDDLALRAAEARASGGLVVAGGGDGTIAAVAAALVGSDAVLGVLPMGTLNHFAKDLGIPLQLEAAVHTLFTGKVVRVDVGDVNGHIFLNNSSIGFYPRIVQERRREQRQGRNKWIALAQATALIFRKSRSLHVELAGDDGDRQAYDTPFVFVGNNRYNLAGLEIGTRAVLDGGKLWICAAPHAGRFALVGLAVGALLGFVKDADLAAFETGQIDIHMRRTHVQVATDGEVNVMRTPLHYRSRPGALRVIVPSSVD